MNIGRNEKALFITASIGCFLALAALLTVPSGAESKEMASDGSSNSTSRPTSQPTNQPTSRPANGGDGSASRPTSSGSQKTSIPPGEFPTEDYNSLLDAVVAENGFVDYKTLVNQHGKDLDALARAIAETDGASLESLGDAALIAWYANAYNILTLKTIVDNYPVDSIRDIEEPWDTAMTVAGEQLTLNDIEHKKLRLRDEPRAQRVAFVDPRLHFGVNCASIGCPRLQGEAFTGENLDELFDKGVRDFLAEDRNFRVEGNTIHLSELLDWYGEDFQLLYEESELKASSDRLADNGGENPMKIAAVGKFFADYVKEEQVAERLRTGDFELQWQSYDWGLNAIGS